MTAKIIDGNEISQALREEWRHRADKLKDNGILPGLAVIIVGDNPASRVYVRNKIKACHEVAGSPKSRTKGPTSGRGAVGR